MGKPGWSHLGLPHQNPRKGRPILIQLEKKKKKKTIIMFIIIDLH